MRTIGIIPARYASTRLPGKPLEMIGDRSLIMRVYEQAKKVSSLDRVLVATDDQRIFDHVKECGGEVVMTSDIHETGTERCLEAYQSLGEDFDYILNIQGDEPFIEPASLEGLIQSIEEGDELLTLVKEIETKDDLFDVHLPKVVLGEGNRAVYFSRSALPHLRGIEEAHWIQHSKYYKHIGIYLYRSDVLATIVGLSPSTIEKMEQLEQLRWLANGLHIKAVKTDHDSISVDTPEDLRKARAQIASDYSN